MFFFNFLLNSNADVFCSFPIVKVTVQFETEGNGQNEIDQPK